MGYGRTDALKEEVKPTKKRKIGTNTNTKSVSMSVPVQKHRGNSENDTPMTEWVSITEHTKNEREREDMAAKQEDDDRTVD